MKRYPYLFVDGFVCDNNSSLLRLSFPVDFICIVCKQNSSFTCHFFQFFQDCISYQISQISFAFLEGIFPFLDWNPTVNNLLDNGEHSCNIVITPVQRNLIEKFQVETTQFEILTPMVFFHWKLCKQKLSVSFPTAAPHSMIWPFSQPLNTFSFSV